MSLLDKFDELEKDKEIKETKPTPPRAPKQDKKPKTPKKETKPTLHPPPDTIIEVPDIDLKKVSIKLATSTTFQRLLLDIAKELFPQYKFPPKMNRKSKDVMANKFKNSIKDINSAVKLKQEIKALPPELINELKERFKQKNNGLISI